MCFFSFYIFLVLLSVFAFFFFKQKTAYEMRISDWSSDVCSSDLQHRLAHVEDENLAAVGHAARLDDKLRGFRDGHEIAGDVSVGDRHRAARSDLLLEQRNH